MKNENEEKGFSFLEVIETINFEICSVSTNIV